MRRDLGNEDGNGDSTRDGTFETETEKGRRRRMNVRTGRETKTAGTARTAKMRRRSCSGDGNEEDDSHDDDNVD